MCGRQVGLLLDQEGGLANPVPHLGGLWRTQWPMDGSICLRVDHCSQQEDGADAKGSFSSSARENDLRGGSEGGTQWSGTSKG